MEKHKLVLIEGLCGYSKLPFIKNRVNFLYRGVKKALNMSKFEIDHRPYTDKSPVDKDSIIIGHSFGGVTAMELAYEHGCKALFTLDARGWDFWNNRHHRRGKAYADKTFMHYNFYQAKGLRGYLVLGAENKRIENTTHTDIVNNAEFLFKVMDEVCIH